MGFRRLTGWLAARLAYEVELATLLLLVLAAGITYGILEAVYIPTDTMRSRPLPGTGGHVACYHLCLLGLMAVVSFALAWLHIQEIATHRKKYTLLMGAAAMPLSLLVEDVTWFLTRRQQISADEWTIWPRGWSMDLGFSHLPLWYLGVLAWSGGLLWLASRCAERGHQVWRMRARLRM